MLNTGSFSKSTVNGTVVAKTGAYINASKTGWEVRGWTPVDPATEIWQDAANASEEWTALSPTSTEWNAASATDETWADAA